MNKLYSLLGIGLLSAATLSSCKEDVIIEGSDNGQWGEPQTYTAIASIYGYKSTEQDPSTRANVQDDGSSFMWNTGDQVTLWNGTNGYPFTAINYNESDPSGNVEFTGSGSFENGATVWGVYPKKESPTAANVFSFTLGDATQSADKPELQHTMHMLAKGTVNGNTVTNLKFEHQTALFQFKMTNRRSDAYKVTKVVVSCKKAIFPKTLTVAGEEKTYSDKVTSLTLNMANLEIAKGANSYAYLSFFPLVDMTADTELTFTATVEKVGVAGTTETVEKTGKVSELYNAESVVASDGYKYVSGKKYGVSFTLVTDLGYVETEPGKYLVKKEEGLINLASEPTIMTNAATVITLEQDLDMIGKSAWTPVAEFKGTLDGNGMKIAHIIIANSGTSVGLFVKNSGTIKNLTLENVSVPQVSGTTAAGTIAATNGGTIQNCKINGGKMVVQAANAHVGALVGQSSGATAVIADCKIEGNLTLEIASGKANVGILVGTNGNWNASSITGSSVGENVSLVFKGTSDSTIGGFVGWNNGGKVLGCYSLGLITTTMQMNAGGLIGADGGEIATSYAAGEIRTTLNAACGNIGGLVKNGNEMKGCYSTMILPTSSFGSIGGISASTFVVTNLSECYFINDNVTNPGKNVSPTTKLENAAALVGVMSAMNTASSESGFEFFENTGSNKTKIPLLIRKK